MTEQTEIPQPVQWAVNVCAQETARVTKIDSDIAAMDERIIATQALLDQMVADKDVAMNARVTSAANAALAREMAETVCSAHGWAMPEIPSEAPMHQTTAFPAQNGSAPSQTVPDRSASDRMDVWLHGVNLTALIEQRVTVAYADGNAMTGTLTEVSADSITFHQVDNWPPGESFRPRIDVISAVAPAPPIDQTQVVPAQPWSQEDAWKPLMGQRITVSYADGSTVTGVLEDTSYRRYRLTDVPGYPADEVYVGSLASVTGVVPAQDASAPLCKNCGKPIAIDRQDDWFHIDADGGTYACYPDAVISTDAEPSPPPADQPTPPGRPLPDSDPTQRVDVTEAQGGAS